MKIPMIKDDNRTEGTDTAAAAEAEEHLPTVPASADEERDMAEAAGEPGISGVADDGCGEEPAEPAEEDMSGENGDDSAVKGGLQARLEARKQALLRRIEYKRLKRIRKRTVPAYTHCKNCGERLQGMYCSRCGQYALDIEQPFWKYIKQYFENVYQFDSKVWQTLWLMFRRPGLLTCEFNAGKINSYVHPFRLYMFISVIFFTIFFMFASDIARRSVREIALQPHHLPDTVLVQLRAGHMRPDTCVYMYDGSGFAEMLELKKVPTDDLIAVTPVFGSKHGISVVEMPHMLLDSCLYRTELAKDDLDNINVAKQTIASCIQSQQNVETEEDLLDAELDRLGSHLDMREAVGENRLSGFDLEGYDAEILERLLEFDTARTPVYDWRRRKMDPEQMQEHWHQESFVNNMLADLSKWTPLYMMFLLPLFALLLKAAYRKQRMNYMQHFVHAVHINSFFLVLVSIPVAIMIYSVEMQSGINGMISWSFKIFFALIFIYMLLSSRTVYREGWFKTVMKTLLVFGGFSLLALILALALVLWRICTHYYQ